MLKRTAEVLASLESEVQRMTQAESKLAAENQALREELEALKSGKVTRRAKSADPIAEPIEATGKSAE